MTTEVIPLSAMLPVLGVAIWCVWPVYTIPETPDCYDFPPSLPLPPPLLCPLSSSALLPLHPASPSAYPQPSICGLESLRPCQSPAQARSEDPHSLPPTSETRTPPRPVDHGSTMALSSLVSTMAHQSTSSAGLPRPSGSALVVRQPALALRLYSSGFASSLRPSGSGSGSTVAFLIPACASVAWAICSALALRIICITLAHRLSVSALSSLTTGSASISRPPGVISPFSTIAPPSIGSSVGHLPGWALERLSSPPAPGSSLVPPSVFSSLVPPSVFSSLVPPSVFSSLVIFVHLHLPGLCCCPSPSHLATSRTSSCMSVPALCQPPCVFIYTVLWQL